MLGQLSELCRAMTRSTQNKYDEEYHTWTFHSSCMIIRMHVIDWLTGQLSPPPSSLGVGRAERKFYSTSYGSYDDLRLHFPHYGGSTTPTRHWNFGTYVRLQHVWDCAKWKCGRRPHFHWPPFERTAWWPIAPVVVAEDSRLIEPFTQGQGDNEV